MSGSGVTRALGESRVWSIIATNVAGKNTAGHSLIHETIARLEMKSVMISEQVFIFLQSWLSG